MTLVAPPSSPPVPPADFADITQRLDTLGARFRLASILRSTALFLAIFIPAATLTLFIAGFFNLSRTTNISLLILLIAAMIYAYFRLLHHPIFHRPTYAEVARMIEQHTPADLDLSNHLINAVLLADDLEKSPSRRSWIPPLLHEVSAHTAALPLERTVPWKKSRNAFLIAGLFALGCIAIGAMFPATFAHGFAVLTRPSAFVPRQGAVRILTVLPGNDTILAGQSIDFVATINSPESRIVPTRIQITFASGKTINKTMQPFGTDNNQYKLQGIVAAEDMDYYLTAGDTQSENFHITVPPQIHLTSFSLEAVPPAYTCKEKFSLTLSGKDATAGKASAEIPVGSQVTLSISLDIPAKELLLDPGSQPIAFIPSADAKTFTTTFTLQETLRYTLRINDSSNRTLHSFPESTDPQSPAQYTLTAALDQPPTIAVTEPAKDTDALPGAQLPLAAQATDDYALTAIALQTSLNNDKEFHTLQTWPITPKDNKPVRAATVKHLLELPASQFKLSDTLRYRFVSTDNRPESQSTAGEVFSITFNDKAASAARDSKLWEQLRQQLAALLDRQIALRKQSAGLTAQTALTEMRQTTSPITDGQKSLRTDMAAIAKDFPFEPSMKLIQKSLQVLVLEDATSAIDRASDILLLADAKSLLPLSSRLRQHQSRIIDILQALLAIAQSEENHANKLAHKEGGDIPSDARDAWKKLAEELKKFQKEQKAVIEATADLAKKPKDQYDANDKKKLAELAAIEDKWERFLSQKIADMSKIAEQDQANKTVQDELIQMKVELAAAKNALQTQATEIATPLEENGLESAKTLDTHIERMLMQTPDRIAWQMEEPITQNDPAMAELPQQAQDMIGELMDREEDLTEAMESTASKWADSLNKGAGWDAMDGPISNMSAQGVTGNQIPKNMEIQGRSLEGREGRSSGEFVGASAEGGKEGRRTPTRMTQDPFSAGQVQDNSKDPIGGATGGGKKGSVGAEGLEGPGPNDPNQIAQRLAGAQAAIRNEAERLQLQMHAAGFENFKLVESNVLLKMSEAELRQYHYQTALYYQRQAVQSLNTAKVLAAGHVHVIADTSPTMDKKTQKEIESAQNGPLPKGYADPVKAYFQKLANEPE